MGTECGIWIKRGLFERLWEVEEGLEGTIGVLNTRLMEVGAFCKGCEGLVCSTCVGGSECRTDLTLADGNAGLCETRNGLREVFEFDE